MIKSLLATLLIGIASISTAVAQQAIMGLPGRPVVLTTQAAGGVAGGGAGGNGFDLVIDSVAFGTASSNHFLDINYTFSAGVDGVCVVASEKDSSAFTLATLAGAPMLFVARSPRSSGYLQVGIWCATATASGTQEIEVVKSGDSPMAGVVIGFKGMKQTGYDFIHSSGTASDVSTTATALSTGTTVSILKNIIISGFATYDEKAMVPDSGNTQLAQVAVNGMSLIVSYRNASGGADSVGASWSGGSRTEGAYAEVNDDPLEAP